jgi:hypothetical protein
MAVTKVIQENKKKSIFVVSIIGLSVFFAWGLIAQDIPQEIGFKDIEFASLNRDSCVDCHGDALVDTHHKTTQATSGDCTSCHGVSRAPGKVGVTLERNCMNCHTKSPHHRTEAAQTNECGTCHDSPGVSDYSTEVPVYKVSDITPTVDDCRTCHKEGTVDGQKVVGMKQTHHGIALKGCNSCHDEQEKKNTSIRICERCHSVKAIHEVLPHVEKDACVKCHSGKGLTEPTK